MYSFRYAEFEAFFIADEQIHAHELRLRSRLANLAEAAKVEEARHQREADIAAVASERATQVNVQRMQEEDAERQAVVRERAQEKSIGIACGQSAKANAGRQKVFDTIDTDRDGVITVDQMCDALQRDLAVSTVLGLPRRFHEDSEDSDGGPLDGEIRSILRSIFQCEAEAVGGSRGGSDGDRIQRHLFMK